VGSPESWHTVCLIFVWKQSDKELLDSMKHLAFGVKNSVVNLEIGFVTLTFIKNMEESFHLDSSEAFSPEFVEWKTIFLK